MKQFWTLCINGALIAILGMVDSAFGNNLGIDSIVVLASWGTLCYLFNKLGMLGDCCYQCDTTKFTESVIINIVTTMLAGLVMIVTSQFTASLFELSERQHELLVICSVVYGCGIVFAQIEHIFNKYLIFNNMNKQLIGATVLFYVFMLACDAVVLIRSMECYWLIVGTVFSNIVTDIYYLLVCQVYKGFRKPDFKGSLKGLLHKGLYMWFERILNALAYMLGSVIASYLGEFEYAVHSVCIGIAGCTEDVTNCWCQNQIVKLQSIATKDKYYIFKEQVKKTFFPAVSISLVLAFALLVPMKGDLPFDITLKFLILYLSQIFALCLYENYRGFTTSLGYTQCMVVNSIVGIGLRLVWATLCVTTPLGLYGFAFMISICFIVRGVMYAIAVKIRYGNIFVGGEV